MSYVTTFRLIKMTSKEYNQDMRIIVMDYKEILRALP